MIGPQFPEEVPTRVPDRTLREFAGLCLAILGGLFALSWYRHQHAPSAAAWIAAALAVLIGVPGLIRPNSIRPVYLGAIALTKPIGHVLGLVLLAVIYYGVMTPLALVFRLAGRDGLGRYRWGSRVLLDRPRAVERRAALLATVPASGRRRRGPCRRAGIGPRTCHHVDNRRRTRQPSVLSTPRSQAWISLSGSQVLPATSNNRGAKTPSEIAGCLAIFTPGEQDAQRT